MYLQSVQQGETIGDLPHVGNLTLSLDPGVGASETGVVTVTAIGMVDHRLVDFSSPFSGSAASPTSKRPSQRIPSLTLVQLCVNVALDCLRSQFHPPGTTMAPVLRMPNSRRCPSGAAI